MHAPGRIPIWVIVFCLVMLGVTLSYSPSPGEPKHPSGGESPEEESSPASESGIPTEAGNANLIAQAKIFQPMKSAVQGRTARGQSILDAPAFTVPLRKENLEYYPCADCHEDEPDNPGERVLEEEHEDLRLEHGGGRFWCPTCHGSKDKNTLTSLKGLAIDFDQAFLLCGQCHFQRQKDWYFGGHGKRIGTWRKPRVINSCPECHDPHSPSIKPFVPAPPPLVRSGLRRPTAVPKRVRKPWEREPSDRGH